MDKYLAHILVVDDDDRIRELVKQYLLDNKYLGELENGMINMNSTHCTTFLPLL